MTTFTEFIKNNKMPILILGALIALAAVIFLLKKMIVKGQKKKELLQAAEDKLRDENLNQVILNSDTGSNPLKEIYKPYDVDYGNSGGDKKSPGRNTKQGENHVMVQLIERTALSTRKFMMNPVKKIHIGSDSQDNDITVLAPDISPRQCEIFSVRDKVFIRNLSSKNRTIIRRKKEQAIADDKGIRLLSGDTIILGNVSYDITIVS